MILNLDFNLPCRTSPRRCYRGSPGNKSLCYKKKTKKTKWPQRSIYSGAFFRKLQKNLNWCHRTLKKQFFFTKNDVFCSCDLILNFFLQFSKNTPKYITLLVILFFMKICLPRIFLVEYQLGVVLEFLLVVG